jgi:hypothetical protein
VKGLTKASFSLWFGRNGLPQEEFAREAMDLRLITTVSRTLHDGQCLGQRRESYR